MEWSSLYLQAAPIRFDDPDVAARNLVSGKAYALLRRDRVISIVKAWNQSDISDRR